MCGIAVLLEFESPHSNSEDLIQRMMRSMLHRGPDAGDFRVFADGRLRLAFGHRRLSIVDLTGGSQPMSNEDESVWVCYNGEIYNHASVAQKLQGCGHRYRTRCDTETIVHAYEQWGPKALDELRGMFAFAIWDQNTHTLFAARDRMGIKPLYYAVTDQQLILASEIKAILATGMIPPELNVSALAEQMTFGYLSGEETLFRGIKKLLPGHYLTWRQGKLNVCCYWDIPQAQTDPDKSDDDYIEQFREIFDASVTMRLMSDVPLGVFLSGGLDSSVIAATMAKNMDGQLKTFSVGFESQYFSEFSYARDVAKLLNTDHREIVLTPDAFFESLPQLLWHEDEPIRSSPSVALYHVAKLAREHVTVVLTGEGSDELFAGYDRYWATLFNLRWGKAYDMITPRWLRDSLIRQTLWQWPIPESMKRKVSHTFVGLDSRRPERILFDNWYAIFPQALHAQLFTPEIQEAMGSSEPYRSSLNYYNRRHGASPLERMLYVDQKTYLVELLMKQDNMSMAASIESRVPFLDHRLVEFAATVPPHLKLSGRQGKVLVKKALHERLPESVLKRPKTGFPVPFKNWLREGVDESLGDLLVGERTVARRWVNADFTRRLMEDNRIGRRDYAEQLWTIANLELWARIFLDGQSVEDVTADLMALHRKPSLRQQPSGFRI